MVRAGTVGQHLRNLVGNRSLAGFMSHIRHAVCLRLAASVCSQQQFNTSMPWHVICERPYGCVLGTAAHNTRGLKQHAHDRFFLQVLWTQGTAGNDSRQQVRQQDTRSRWGPMLCCALPWVTVGARWDCFVGAQGNAQGPQRC